MPDNGYLSWDTQTLTFLDLNGFVFRTPAVSMGLVWGPSGIQIPMLSGGNVYQRIPQGPHAPLDLSARAITLEVQIAGWEEYFRAKRITSIAMNQPVFMYAEYPLEDIWPLRGDVWTDWVLSRQTAFGMYAYATSTPECYVQDSDGTQVSQSFTIDTANNSTVLTTPDLSAEAGKYLVFRYYPLMLVTVQGITESIPEPNGMDLSISLAEHVPVRAYG
ncbi:MAG: hypothetical protein HKO76_03920 [Acidimicrobiia bacterium]|nr:hypothetical protein [Acidimicrobiia bacterium]